MIFSADTAEPFLKSLIEALPDDWNGSWTGPQIADRCQEELRLRDLAREARAWAKFLRPDETTGPGERLLLSLGDIDMRYSVVVGLLTGSGSSTGLFVYSPGGLADDHGEFHRPPASNTPGQIALALCRLARAADRRTVEKHLQEAAAEGRHVPGWFPGERIVVLDLETTGLRTDTDRIVEAAWLLADHRALDWNSVLINPGIPIPANAYSIHGIDDLLVSADGAGPRNAIDTLTGALAKHITDGATLVIFNRTYDLPLLDAECRRHSLPTLAERLGHPVQAVDPMRIHQQTQRRGSSTLAALAALHSPGNQAAHSALSDCLATWDVLAALCRNNHKTIVRRFSPSHEHAQPDTPLTTRHLLACSNIW
ncbi:exonuclease domain-containing protein [Streptomyces sp. NPDC005525]|uniref:exonuclease domain-containing protein n=1 Tax=Streptomyces sp. NPDC005525 TaxID=3364720 RepID=UPI0036C2E2AA